MLKAVDSKICRLDSLSFEEGRGGANLKSGTKQFPADFSAKDCFARSSLAMTVVFLSSLLLTCFTASLSAQIPTSCFEIESVLVDACSAPEGENEMVRFRVGPAPLNVSNLNVTWANGANLWLGVCQNAGTTTIVNTINATILGCGVLIEPPGGILPIGAQVILITSTDVQPLAHSFINLNDTVYVIFQCAGNTAGHFANFGTGLRTLTMSFSSPGGCLENVTYDRALLVNIYDTLGGTTASQDGSSVAYAWNNTPTYFNNGCVAPFIPLEVDAGNDTTVCENTSVQLQGAEQSTLQTMWSASQGTFDDVNILNAVFTPSPGAVYPIRVILTGTSQCSTISDTMFIDKFTVFLNAGNDTTVCEDTAVQLQGLRQGMASSTWSSSQGSFDDANILNSVFTPSPGAVYPIQIILSGNSSCGFLSDTLLINKFNISLFAGNDTTVCEGASVQLTSTTQGVIEYTWFTGQGTFSTSGPDPVFTPFPGAAYPVRIILEATLPCANLLDTMFINKFPITVNAGRDTTLCATSSVQLQGTQQGTLSTTWSSTKGTFTNANILNPVFTPSPGAVYPILVILTATSQCGSLSDSMFINQFSIALNAGNDISICEGQSAQLSGSGANTFSWSVNGNVFSNQQNPTVTPAATTIYIVTGDCPGSDTVVVTVNVRESIAVDQDFVGLCPGESTVVTVSGGASYTWFPNDGTVSDVNSASPTISPTGDAVYFATSNGSCPDTVSVTIDVISAPAINISDDTTIFIGGSAVLVANAAGAVSYSWSPASGLSATNTSTVIASPLVTTTYTVTLGGQSCTATASVTVNVSEPPTECPVPVLPSAFTPNDDELNDLFMIVNPQDYSLIEFLVFNRWGENVFRTNSFVAWDGTYKGEPQPMSTFAYTVMVLCPDGNKQKASGAVTLIR